MLVGYGFKFHIQDGNKMIEYTKINDQQIYRETVMDPVSFSPTVRFFVLDGDTKKYFKCEYTLSPNQEPFSEGDKLIQELEKVLIRELTLELEKSMLDE